jgi:hypothetical protein
MHVETAEHVMLFGRVETSMPSSQALEHWMKDADTDPDLIECNVDYVQGRGMVTMASAVQNAPSQFQALGCLQDKIGWATVLGRDGLHRNCGSTATVLRGQWFSDEPG